MEQTEIRTLLQYMGSKRPEAKAAADQELTQHLNDGWAILNLTVLPSDQAEINEVVRVVTLQRVKPAARASAPPVYIPDALPTRGEELLNQALEDMPIARAMQQHGVEAVMNAMNERARAAGQRAFEFRQQGGRLYTRIPLLPAGTKS